MNGRWETRPRYPGRAQPRRPPGGRIWWGRLTFFWGLILVLTAAPGPNERHWVRFLERQWVETNRILDEGPTPVGNKVRRPVRPPSDFEEIIQFAALVWGVEPALIKAVILTESGFVPDAVSPQGARGLMQLMPQTAAELGVEDSFEPRANIMAGTGLLRSYLDRYRSLDSALVAYNAGPLWVGRRGGLPRETVLYIQAVRYFHHLYSRQPPSSAE